MLKMDSQKRPISHIPKEKNYVYSNQLNIPTHQNVQEESMKERNLSPVLEKEKSGEFGNNVSEEPVQADSVVGRDIPLINENNNENAKSLTQDLRDSTQDHTYLSPDEEIHEEIGGNSPQTPKRYINKEFKPKTPVPSISVVPPSDEKSLAKQEKEIVDMKETEVMLGNADQEIKKAETNARNISQSAEVCSDVEEYDSVIEETVSPDLKKPTKGDSKDKQEERLENDYDMVIERDGHFDLVTPDDMNALVNRMKKLPANGPRKQKSTKDQRQQLEPKSHRPLTANLNIQLQRNNLDNRPFSTCSSYNSPYALTAEQKEAVQKQLRITKEKMRKAMIEEKAKEKEKKIINKMAFECWLNQTKEKEMAVKKQWKLQEEMERNKREEEERIRKETDIHRIWVQKKHKQLKQERLLRKRQQQEMDSVKKYRSPEEIENAYQRWLESKYLEKKKQKYLKKQKNWFHQRLLHRSRLIKNMTWNLCLNNSFRYKEPRNAALKLK
ncbi:coiled-coil domain-containing protein 181 isoform X3 [Octopus bimaculoides]|uniref:Coiled-coil domain-containing protein 181 n=1 Tax=Octopus bimaculoides TaxID=37653 RepID=A0A0L8G490_OCTBM|nr:coiled-coil domain-containing protein 181 isoform X3 [Octopus bimaculoides]|eukprot:XP_014784361.1 PREDICTED: coiled-coil domain-containing protein 181-like isoform X2 [Octopus bimaculoides]